MASRSYVQYDPLDVLAVVESRSEDGEGPLDGGINQLGGRLGVHVERRGLQGMEADSVS